MRPRKNGEPGIVHRRCQYVRRYFTGDAQCSNNAEPGTQYCQHHQEH